MRLSSIARLILFIATLLSALITIKLFYDYYQLSKNFNNTVATHGKRELHDVKKLLEEKLGGIEDLAQKLSQTLSTQQLSQQDISKIINDAAQSNSLIISIGAAYKPYAYDKNKHFFAREYVRSDGKIEEILLEKFYDYTNASWFKNGLDKRKYWTEPYYSSVINKLIVTYSVAITHVDEKTNNTHADGVVFINLTLQDISALMGLANIQYAESSFLLSNNGTILFYPSNTAYSEQRKTIFDISHEHGKQALFEIGSHMTHAEQGCSEFNDSENNKNYWIFYEPLRNGWSIGLFIEKSQSLGACDTLKKKSIQCVVALIVLLLLGLILAVNSYSVFRLSWITALLSGAIAFAIVFIWNLELTLPRDIPHNIKIISNNADLQRFVRFQSKLNVQLNRPEIIYIPTSVYISAVSFTNTTVSLQGYIWQMYGPQAKNLQRGVRITNAASSTITQAYQKTTEDGELQGYYFSATFNTHFSVLKYPFDRQTLSMSLSPVDFVNNIILIPDFDSWDLSRARSRIGLAQDIKAVWWHIDLAYFSYQTSDLTTDFGIDSFVRQKEFPEFQFNIALHRNFREPLINNLLPLGVVFFLVFCTLLLTGPIAESVSLISIVSGFTSILFSTIIAQQKMQSSLGDTGQAIYLEFFYYVAYIFIFLVTFDAIILQLTGRIALLRAHNNLFAKLIYWPLVLLTILTLTIITFY